MHCRSGFKKGATSCRPTFNWAPAIPNGRFFQRSESPRNISGSSEIWDLCCMLNHFSAKLPKLSKLITGGHLDWLGPKWFKIVPKRAFGAMGPKWSKMVPKPIIWNIQAALCPRLFKMLQGTGPASVFWGASLLFRYFHLHPSTTAPER